ncbi:MAG: ROK family protein [Chitinophagaceae bacterium]|nr:ROK family protein [Chitinophagaceae bacterium]
MALITHKKNLFYAQLTRHLFFHNHLSSTELSELTGKSIPVTTQGLNELIKKGKVFESGFAESTGGRKPLLYSLTEGSLLIVSVAMDQLITKIALINEKNEIVGEIEKHNLKLADNPSSIAELIKILKNFVSRINKPDKVVGIGIGMPGFVDSLKGVNYSFLQTENGTLVEALENELHLPVFIENDSSLIALAELRWGAAYGRKNVMVINIGWGVGLGIISKGELFKGHDGFAGEFSHISLFDNQKLCSCGKYGCLETETSLVVIAQKAIKKMTEGELTVLKNLSENRIEEGARKILKAAKEGDKFSIEVISESAYHIGRGISILIHLLNPELVIISGIGSLAGKVWIAPVQIAINEHCIPKMAEHTEIKISKLGEEAALIGAAALVMEHFEEININLKKIEKVLIN